MDSRRAAELAAWVDGRVVGDPDTLVGPDVVIDSRKATPGALFAALPGEHADGHEFAAAAAANGAAAALVSREVPGPAAQIAVPDVLTAFGVLAARIVAEAKENGLVTLGITGSTGKTSTKDLLGQVLAGAAPAVFPEGSFNNEIGVPLTACRVDSHTKYLLAEMGARGIGHLSRLKQIVPLDIALVLNVGVAHIGEFGSPENIAKAKGELVEGDVRWAVLNADDPAVAAMRGRTQGRVAAFSAQGEPSFGELGVWAQDVEEGELLAFRFTLATNTHGAAPVTLRVPGRHQVGNALAAAAAALCAGLTVEQVADGLSQAQTLSRWRMELRRRPDGLLVLNDAYNANPESMRAALDALKGLRQEGGKLIAVLGEMLELGPDAPELHREIGAYARGQGVDELIAVGEHAAETVAGFGSGPHARAVPNREAAAEIALSCATPSDVALVKASRGIALEGIAFELLGGE
ncbi:MAG: UDP-N-acetylmuramoyl-tripeptide--D-alanyl-D-alanine ligase [Propionibacteriaceae bacterium]|jgi:UDP-N-acetylmuramoyl-tripeptide--D-alanyl-D-alanine ligase|nr:UDP-N-acetylmuramoyl-tripeptide--D-alanyl-D-alanine ligase [Propionibacteriaceae bacterium]